MFLKGLVITTLVASTPLALFVPQDPQPAPKKVDTTAPTTNDAAPAEARAKRSVNELDALRRELDAARSELQTVRHQLEGALDALDLTFEPQRDRNCSPSRSRALMSHYQWLRDQGHTERATTTVAKIVERLGDDANQLNSTAWHLMTDEESAGKFDQLALALAERMEQRADQLDARQLDTVAMARFLAGHVDRAVELQAQAIERGGNGDEFRRRLRTYRAAQVAIAKASTAPALVPGTVPVGAPATMVATKE